MNKSIGLGVSIIGGVAVGLLSFYILSIFEDETKVLTGLMCAVAAFIAFIGIVFLTSKAKQDSSRKEQCIRKGLYTIFFAISFAVTALAIWAKEEHDWRDKRDKSEQTLGQRMVANGWEYVFTAEAYQYKNGDWVGSKNFRIYYKNEHDKDRYSAVYQSSATGCDYKCSVTKDNYYVGGNYFEARISFEGDTYYFNF